MRRILILTAGLLTGCGTATTSQAVDQTPSVSPADSGQAYPGGKVYLESEVDSIPDVIRAGKSRYPEVLRDAGTSGRVVVQFVVDATGHVDTNSFRVISTTHPGFVDPVRNLVFGTTFRPGKFRGEPVAVQVQQTVQFTP